MGDSNNKSRLHYGWIIVGTSFIIMAIAWSSVFNISGLFIKPISKDLGFSISEYSATITIRSATLMLVSLFAGKIYSRFNIVRTMKVATIILIISFFLLSMANSLIVFYLLTIIIGISVSLVGTLPISIILSNWFNKYRGFVLGLGLMGSGVGGMILSSLVGNWLVTVGWRMTYRYLTIIMIIFLVPCTMLLIHERPKDKKLLPYGSSQSNRTEILNLENEGIMLKEAFKTAQFWSVCICSIFIMIGVNMLMFTVSPHLTDIGYSIPFSANIVALTMGSVALGKLILGRIYDRFGLRTALTISSLSVLFGVIGLLNGKYIIALAVVVIFSGIGSAYGTIAANLITLGLYGQKDYNSIFGFISAFVSLGGVIGPIFSGFMYDITGGYESSYIISIILCLIAVIIIQIIFIKPSQKTILRNKNK